MNNSNVNTTSPMDLTEPGFPGKGISYDWHSVLTEAAAADLDAELALELAVASAGDLAAEYTPS